MNVLPARAAPEVSANIGKGGGGGEDDLAAATQRAETDLRVLPLTRTWAMQADELRSPHAF